MANPFFTNSLKQSVQLLRDDSQTRLGRNNETSHVPSESPRLLLGGPPRNSGTPVRQSRALNGSLSIGLGGGVGGKSQASGFNGGLGGGTSDYASNR